MIFRSIHRLLAAPAAVAALVLLSSCSGGGSDTTRLFFGSNGAGRCDQIVVEVDLDDAGAVLERLESGAADCGAGRDVVANLCDISFEEVGGGSRLRVTIDECRMDAVADLFQCAFQRGDADAIEQALDISCDCVGDACDSSPPVCVDGDSDPGSCEDCSNGADDDGNGDEDCNDENCENREPCASPPTSSTSSSTTSSSTTVDTGDTTTSTTVTTTTLPGSSSGFDVIFRLEKAATFGSLQFDIHYGAIAAAARQRAVTGVTCESLVEGALAEFNDEPSEDTVHAGLISLAGFTGPTDLALCNFETDTVPEEADFDIDVIEALDPDLNPISGTQIVVDEIIPVTTTTLPSVTTTSMPGTTTTTTTTLPVGPAYIVSFQLASASTPLGALQITTAYSTSKGAFEGAGGSVQCTNDATGALFAPNHVSGSGSLTLGFIALTPISPPTPLANCKFLGNGSAAPTASDFPITIEDITDGDGNAATATITVSIQAFLD
jgi:hypothetical protein